jgi:DNA polymerase-3 subunit alpha
MYLSSISYLYHYKNNEFPIIPWQELIAYKDGIVVIVNYLESEVGFHLNLFNQENFLNGAGGIEKAREILKEYKNEFSDLYLEIRRDGFKEEKFIENDVLKLSQEFNIHLVYYSNLD